MRTLSFCTSNTSILPVGFSGGPANAIHNAQCGIAARSYFDLPYIKKQYYWHSMPLNISSDSGTTEECYSTE